jgi:hypothetical protein
MQLGFNTDSLPRARAALLLYAMYRSRETNSSLNGLDTWSRCASYIRGALLKSETLGQFVSNFCKKAGVGAIKPIHLKTDGLVKIDDAGTLARVDGVYNYQLQIFDNNNGAEVLNLFTAEAQYIIMLVRERIQREKGIFNDDTDD